MAKKSPKKFAQGMNFYKLVWAFAIFAIFGTIYEEIIFIFFSLTLHGEWAWEPRSGVFWGPFSPIYGVGAILILYPLTKWHTFKPCETFFLSGLIGGAFEFFASLLQEWIMGTRSWDYSDHILNFDGRTSIIAMTIWGFLGVVLIHIVWPPISRWIENWPPKLGKRLTIILAVFLLADCTVTATALIRQNHRSQGLPPATPVGELSDQLFPDDYIRQKIPNLRSLK